MCFPLLRLVDVYDLLIDDSNRIQIENNLRIENALYEFQLEPLPLEFIDNGYPLPSDSIEEKIMHINIQNAFVQTPTNFLDEIGFFNEFNPHFFSSANNFVEPLTIQQEL